MSNCPLEAYKVLSRPLRWPLQGGRAGPLPLVRDTLHRQSVVWLENAKKSSNRARRLAAAPHAARHTAQTLIQHWPHGRCSAELRFDNQPTTRCRVLRASVLRGGNGPEQWHRKVGDTWSMALVLCSLLVVGALDAHWVRFVCERRIFTMVALARRDLLRCARHMLQRVQ